MKRLQRLRYNQHIRDLCSETNFSVSQLIQPLFLVEGLSEDENIPGLGETKRQNLNSLLKQIKSDLEKGVKHFILFPVPEQKKLSEFKHDFSIEAIKKIRSDFGNNIQLWVDTCLCAYTSHGHCCLFSKEGRIDSEATLKALADQAITFAEAGADGISPSDMMDGRVGKMRESLDQRGKTHIPIMSYSTKFASQFYGPFRNAAQSTPQFGYRKQYQIDDRNRTDAINSSVRCAEEGADLLMVKPGMTSIDLIGPIRKKTSCPVGAFQVSGEFAGLMALNEKNLISDFDAALLETWNVFRRAGAQFIITYGARLAKNIWNS